MHRQKNIYMHILASLVYAGVGMCVVLAWVGYAEETTCRSDEEYREPCIVCQKGLCTRSPASCVNDDDCASPTPFCGEKKKCVECKRRMVCRGHFDCIEGQCVELECSFDYHCADGSVCFHGRCKSPD